MVARTIRRTTSTIFVASVRDEIGSGSTEFISRDPAVAKTRSAYGYVGGNPLNATDPTGLYDYQYDWRIGTTGATGGSSRTMRYLQEHMGSLFPFSTGNCSRATPAEICNLNAFGMAAPVQVSTECTAMIFTALPGHCDDPGSTIDFSTYESNGEVYLRETAHANTRWFLDPFAPLIAWFQWSQLADNLRSAVNPNGEDVPPNPWFIA